ncbi:hypothetical protein KW798_00170 [Candidatus Parcubacteria bacterium]|nr:hypothetical protein [Candidatus Parcubacteria bacterium]
MCDYSAKDVKKRAAEKNDILVSHSISRHTRGFVAVTDPTTAVCLLPGTELAFDKEIAIDSERAGFIGFIKKKPKVLPWKVARFVQVDKDNLHQHHDALMFPDGKTVKLDVLVAGQTATVLQLPADPKTKEEAKALERADYV